MARTAVSLSDKILQLLTENHLLTAPQLLEKLPALGTQYNKTSLYRALDKLLQHDKICKLNLLDNEIWYELRSNHHDHVLCVKCNAVETVECGVPQLAETAEANGYQIQHHHLILFGICPNCQKQ